MTAQLVATHAAAVGRPQADSRGDGHEPTATTGAHEVAREVALRALVDGCSPTATTSSADAIAAGAKSLSADVRVLPFPACLRANSSLRSYLPSLAPSLPRKEGPSFAQRGRYLPSLARAGPVRRAPLLSAPSSRPSQLHAIVLHHPLSACTGAHGFAEPARRARIPRMGCDGPMHLRGHSRGSPHRCGRARERCAVLPEPEEL